MFFSVFRLGCHSTDDVSSIDIRPSTSGWKRGCDFLTENKISCGRSTNYVFKSIMELKIIYQNLFPRCCNCGLSDVIFELIDGVKLAIF